MQTYDVLVRGSGCVGRSLALALGAQGLRVALLGSAEATPTQREDLRSYALNAAAVRLLRDLKVWESLPPSAVSPVYDMKIHGDAPGSLLEFSAWSQGVSELAFIVDAGALEQQLAVALRFSPHVQLVDAPVPAALTALCEGRASAARSELGVKFELNSYGQRGIAARLRCERSHQGVARQWFRSPDVLALLPIASPEAGASYGLVWSVPEARADELLALDEASFEAALNDICGAEVGGLSLASARGAWPLALARAEPVQGPGWVLLGDAAHLVHPLCSRTSARHLGHGRVDRRPAALVRQRSGPRAPLAQPGPEHLEFPFPPEALADGAGAWRLRPPQLLLHESDNNAELEDPGGGESRRLPACAGHGQ
ncbi:MAG: 2-octaprenyl-3-methyl-6-methoxy-1,4-benzoquinol hydroxylase [Paucibacter sp.]|nr:2-octaprenyl-3-methyl-6-methoxy-1,4-benzoquinol hydroxylase [Roseateles sp.]